MGSSPGSWMPLLLRSSNTFPAMTPLVGEPPAEASKVCGRKTAAACSAGPPGRTAAPARVRSRATVASAGFASWEAAGGEAALPTGAEARALAALPGNETAGDEPVPDELPGFVGGRLTGSVGGFSTGGWAATAPTRATKPAAEKNGRFFWTG